MEKKGNADDGERKEPKKKTTSTKQLAVDEATADEEERLTAESGAHEATQKARTHTQEHVALRSRSTQRVSRPQSSLGLFFLLAFESFT